MPTDRLPLAGSYNQRTIDGTRVLNAGQDQRYLNCTFRAGVDATGRPVVYVERRPGWKTDNIVLADNASTGLLKTDFIGSVVSAFGTSNSTIYDGGVSVGAITGRALFLSETLISDVGYVLIKSSDGTGWYYAADAKDQLTYTGNTNSNATIDNITSTAGMYIGQAVSGTDIPAGARILTVSANSITITANATGTTAGITITKTPIAKILDSDFVTTGSTVGAFVELDGYHFYPNADGYIYNSDVNSITNYTSGNRLAAQMSPDPATAIARHKNMIIAWGHSSMEAFYNAGNATGSPLSRAPQFFSRTGALDQRSIATLLDDIYYVSSAKYGDVSVMRLRNLQPQKVSSPEVDKTIGTSAADDAYVYLSAFQLGGQPYVSAYVTNAPDDEDLLLLETGENLLLESDDDIILENATAEFARMMVYNADLNVWSEWDCDEATFIVGAGSGPVNKLLATSRVLTAGKVYTINPASDGEVHTDDGTAFTAQIRTARITHGTENRKFVKSIRLVADTQATGAVTLEASDDDFSSWVTLGSFDLTQNDKRIYGCGSYTGGRAYRLSHATDGAFRAEALEIDYDVATT